MRCLSLLAHPSISVSVLQISNIMVIHPAGPSGTSSRDYFDHVLRGQFRALVYGRSGYYFFVLNVDNVSIPPDLLAPAEVEPGMQILSNG